MALRDFLLAPPAESQRPEPRRTRTTEAPSLAVLAPPRDLPAMTAATGLALRGPAVLAFLLVAHEPAPPLIPPRPAATRLARSLTARGVAAQPRGRLALADVTAGGSAARAFAAAGGLPTVLGVAARGADVDELLAACDAILVALPPGADSDLAELAVTGAAALGRAVVVEARLDPLSRALAVAGVRAPRAVLEVVRGVVA